MSQNSVDNLNVASQEVLITPRQLKDEIQAVWLHYDSIPKKEREKRTQEAFIAEFLESLTGSGSGGLDASLLPEGLGLQQAGA